MHILSCGNFGQINDLNKNYIVSEKKKNCFYFDHFRNNDAGPFKVDVAFNRIAVSYSTITSGIHFAAFLGAKNIILAGHDCGTLDGDVYFSDYHTKETIKINWKNVNQYKEWVTSDAIEKQTIYLKQILKDKFDINVYSINPFINFNLEGHEYAK